MLPVSTTISRPHGRNPKFPVLLNIRRGSSIKYDDSRWGAVGAEAHLDGLILARFCTETKSGGEEQQSVMALQTHTKDQYCTLARLLDAVLKKQQSKYRPP